MTEQRPDEGLKMSEHRGDLAKGSRLVLGVAAMGSGAALLVAIFFGVSLAFTLLLFALFASFVFYLKYSNGRSADRLDLTARVDTGLLAGILATLVYDLFRVVLVKSLGLSFPPLGALPHFGHLLMGNGASMRAAWIAGSIYHYLNGITFSIAYCFAFGGLNWKWGIAWAMGLEIAMFTVYPGWLHLSGMMEEFTLVSLSGHVAYGVVLGVVSQRYLHRVREHGPFGPFSSQLSDK